MIRKLITAAALAAAFTAPAFAAEPIEGMRQGQHDEPLRLRRRRPDLQDRSLGPPVTPI